jgi:hypothetical protein
MLLLQTASAVLKKLSSFVLLVLMYKKCGDTSPANCQHSAEETLKLCSPGSHVRINRSETGAKR